MHVACDLKTQNTVLHIMQFLRPRVAKAPCIFESQLISSNSTVTPTFLYFIKSFTFFMLLCTCSIHLWLFSFYYYYYIFQKQLPLKKGIPTRKIGLIKSIYKNDRRFIEEIRKFSFVVFYESLLTTYIHTRLNIILS